MATFDEILTQVLALLQREGRVAYRVWKRRSALDDEYIEDLKADLIDAKRLAVDEDGKVLVWTEGTAPSPAPQTPDSELRTPNFSRRPTLDPRPVSYTPKHLVDRILAEQAAMEARGATDGERKTITALFADIKGSMALIEDLDPEEARAIVDPALALMMESVHRYEGPQSPTPRRRRKPKRVSLKAIDIARRQEAKSLELRAVTSLSRLWQQQSKKDEARRMLAEIYGWFTEGFDTADLQEAKALLENLR